ncbi:hypothetical protein IAR50_004360 [Cryptococcus sp. DSM 104548]
MPVTVAEPTGPSHPQHHRKRHYTVRKSPYLVSLGFLLVATALTLLNIHVPQLIHVIGRSPGPTQFETRYGLYRRCTRSLPNAPNTTTTALLQSARPLPQDVELPMVQMFDGLPDVETLGGGGIEGPIGHPSEGDGHGWVCQDFPTRSECQQFGEKFCVLWSTAGYAAQSSLVPCLASLFSLLFIFLHRGERTARAKARRQQWKLVSVTMLIHCLLQVLSIAMILHVFRTDGRFETKGSHLDKSFSFGVAAALISLTHTLFLTLTAFSAQKGHTWAAGKSAKKSRRHRRTGSGRVVLVPEGVEVPEGERVSVAEVRAVTGGQGEGEGVGERTGLLEGQSGAPAGGGRERATDSAV